MICNGTRGYIFIPIVLPIGHADHVFRLEQREAVRNEEFRRPRISSAYEEDTIKLSDNKIKLRVITQAA